MKIYTKTGDLGETGVSGGKRLKKSSKNIEAIGEVDELNAFIGLAQTACSEDTKEFLELVQRDLFEIGATLAGFQGKISNENVLSLEKKIDEIQERLKELKKFILPGGSRQGALLHVARSVCRRAERSVVVLSQEEKIDPLIIVYLNRLSDLLFVLARFENSNAGIKETEWP